MLRTSLEVVVAAWPATGVDLRLFSLPPQPSTRCLILKSHGVET